jgi:hypothetical protein
LESEFFKSWQLLGCLIGYFYWRIEMDVMSIEGARKSLYFEEIGDVKKFLSKNDINKEENRLGTYFAWSWTGRQRWDGSRYEREREFGYRWWTFGGWYIKGEEETYDEGLKYQLYGEFIPWTPLQHACGCGREKMVRYLLERGADPTIKDRTGRDALEIARHLKLENIRSIVGGYLHFQSKLPSMRSHDISFIFTNSE